VLGTNPVAGSKLAEGTTIELQVSNGKVDIPSVTGDQIGAATETLSGNQYRLEVVQQPDFTCTGGEVTSQSIKGEHKQRSKITLYYCAGSGNSGNDDNNEDNGEDED